LMNYHQFFLDNINPGDMVLDVGCGKGEAAFDLAKKASEVVAIDLSEKNIKFAQKRYSAPNIKYIIGDATKNLPNERFDAIILSNVLEHIENRTELLRDLKKITPKILIRVPMINRDWITLYKKELGIAWKLDKSHFTEYTIESFQEEIQKAGLKIENYSVQFGEIWGIIANHA